MTNWKMQAHCVPQNNVIILCRLWLIVDMVEMESRGIINCRVVVRWGLVGVRVFSSGGGSGWGGFKRFTGTIKQSVNKSGFFVFVFVFFFFSYILFSRRSLQCQRIGVSEINILICVKLMSALWEGLAVRGKSNRQSSRDDDTIRSFRSRKR